MSNKNKNKIMYLGLINYIETLEETQLNLVFDRTFFTEEVYCKLGYKDYTFDDVYKRLVKKLNDLDFNIYFVVLYLKDVDMYKKRLKRVHHNYQEFSIQSSIDQQNAYIGLADDLDANNINVVKINMDDYEKGYNELISKIPVLKEQKIEYKPN